MNSTRIAAVVATVLLIASCSERKGEGGEDVGASDILKVVYKQHIAHFGEPDQSIVFDGAESKPGFPARIDVLVWNPTADLDMTTFSTDSDAIYLRRAEIARAIERLRSTSDSR